MYRMIVCSLASFFIDKFTYNSLFQEYLSEIRKMSDSGIPFLG
jgi:hypothetical protein